MQYLLYWKPNFDFELYPATHFASDQPRMSRVNRGDIIWIVSVLNGRLYLNAKFKVSRLIEGYDTAVQIIGDQVWEAHFHITDNEPEHYDNIDITDLADQIHFESPSHQKLTLVNGRINAQQLQSMRQLTLETSRLFEQRWSSTIRITSVDADCPPDRILYQNSRIIRDTALSKALKARYNNQCQICGTAIQIGDIGFYSEAHHIRPLGEPHNGPDIAENMIVLCPNHHALFDFGYPVFIDSRAVKIGPNQIALNCLHEIAHSYIEYHNNTIANPKAHTDRTESSIIN